MPELPLPSFEEVCVSSEMIYDGSVVHLFRDRVTLPDGAEANREYIRHVGAVCVLPLGDDGSVWCVRQYRYPFARVLTELPAGKLNSREEDPAEAALRELREETGLRCGKLTALGDLFPSPAILDERIRLFLAEDLTAGESSPDEDEFLSVCRIPLDRLVDQVLSGELPDAKTQVLVLRVAERLRREKEGRL